MVYDGIKRLLSRTYARGSADIIYIRDSYRHKLGQGR